MKIISTRFIIVGVGCIIILCKYLHEKYCISLTKNIINTKDDFYYKIELNIVLFLIHLQAFGYIQVK